MMVEKIGFALFGLGRIGRVHAKNIMLSTRSNLRWVVKNKVHEAEEFVNLYDIPARCTSPGELAPVLEDPSVQAVIVCSPSDSHGPIIEQSLKAGKAVLCEKPITTDVCTTEQCYELAEQQRQPLLCAFNRRFDPSFHSLYERLQSGKFNKLRMVRISSRDHQPPYDDYIKSSGGIFFDSVIHDLDMCTWLVGGAKPVRVFSQGHASSPQFSRHDDVDLQVTTVQFDNGVLGILDNMRQSVQGYDQRIEAVCESGMYCVENRPTDLVTEFTAQSAQPQIYQPCITRYTESFSAVLEHFIDVLQGKVEMLVTKEQTLQAMRLADACTQSYRSGQPVDV